MAEQFLDRAEIAAACQQVRREGMAQRMRRRRFRQAERGAHLHHLALDDSLLQRAALGPAKDRLIGLQMIGAELAVEIDGLHGGGQQRHHARLAALAGDAQCFGPRQKVVRRQRQAFRDAETRTVKQCQHGRIAGSDPGLFCQLGIRADNVKRLACG